MKDLFKSNKLYGLTFSSPLSYISFSPSPYHPTGVSFYIYRSFGLLWYFYLVVIDQQLLWSEVYIHIEFDYSILYNIEFNIITAHVHGNGSKRWFRRYGSFYNAGKPFDTVKEIHRQTFGRRLGPQSHHIRWQRSHSRQGCLRGETRKVLTWLPYDLILTSTIDLVFLNLI